MKFDKRERRIKINGEWYDLCACINCGQVHAIFYLEPSLSKVDKKFKCCKNPDNYWDINGADITIDQFIEKWQD